MRVLISGWFAGQLVGSGQYTDRLLRALRDTATGPLATGAKDTYDLVMPSRRGALAKLAFEQVEFPLAAARQVSDVAHVPYWAPPLRSRVPVVVTVHDLIPLLLPDYRQDLRVRAYTALVAKATPRAAAVIADSEHTARDIAAHLDVPPRRIHVIPLGVDMPNPKPAGVHPGTSERQDESRLDGFKLPPRFGLYFGGFDRRKNLGVLFAAWRMVYASTKLPLIVAGRLPAPGDPLSPHPDELRRQAGLEASAVHFIGPVAEAAKPALYARAAVFAFPSRYEGFGLPPLEAMAAGAPVVSSNAASLPEVVQKAGLLVPPGDEQAWASALQRVLEDEALATHMAAAGRRRAAQLTWAETARRTREVYLSCAALRWNANGM